MCRLIATVIVWGGLIGLAPVPQALAQPMDRAPVSGASAGTKAAPARAQARPKRPPVRVRVTPRCPYRAEASEFPPSADCDFPGPGYVRQCQARLVQEARPSGTVIVPRVRCWWERG